MGIAAVVSYGKDEQVSVHETLCGRRAFYHDWEPLIERLGLKILAGMPELVYVAANQEILDEFQRLAVALREVDDPVFTTRATKIADAIQNAIDSGGGTVSISG